MAGRLRLNKSYVSVYLDVQTPPFVYWKSFILYKYFNLASSEAVKCDILSGSALFTKIKTIAID